MGTDITRTKPFMSSVGFVGVEIAEERTGLSSLPLALKLTFAPDAFLLLESLSGLPHVLLLDSVLRHPYLGRYSYITADPIDWVCAQAPEAPARFASNRTANDDPFALMEQKLVKFKQKRRSDLPPFQGGVAGLLGYGLSRCLERLAPPRRDDFHTPDLAVGLYDWVLAIDHSQNTGWIISTGFPEIEMDGRWRRAQKRLQQVQCWLERGTGSRCFSKATNPATPRDGWPVSGHKKLTSNLSRKSYLEMVDRAIEYIRAGDCFQVNLAQRLISPATMAPLELYRRLRNRNPATFAGYFDLGEFVIASSSPERFLQVIDGEVESRPIKGTRSRSPAPDEDRLRAQQLLSSSKNRAENIMIVDVLRNDLGRVCSYGTVRVPTVCEVETFGFVHHLVSQVRGHLREGLGPIDLLRASFPGGSVTGAPKIRAMEIIAELEPDARGPYCGCLGYIGFDGTMDMNILIRTFTHGRGWLQFPVGGGIVADSTPEREYDESWLKAEGLLRALDQASKT